jgi:hypothetical protein
VYASNLCPISLPLGRQTLPAPDRRRVVRRIGDRTLVQVNGSCVLKNPNVRKSRRRHPQIGERLCADTLFDMFAQFRRIKVSPLPEDRIRNGCNMHATPL